MQQQKPVWREGRFSATLNLQDQAVHSRAMVFQLRVVVVAGFCCYEERPDGIIGAGSSALRFLLLLVLQCGCGPSLRPHHLKMVPVNFEEDEQGRRTSARFRKLASGKTTA